MKLTNEQIEQIANTFVQYTDVVNHTSEDTNITVRNGEIKFQIHGFDEATKYYTSQKLGFDTMLYGGPIFDPEMVRISPLEADQHRELWDKWYSVNFMKIIPLIYLGILKHDCVLAWYDLFFAMRKAYIEEVPENEVLQNRGEKLKCNDIQYKNLNKTYVLPNNSTFTNKIVRFKAEYAEYFATAMPYDEFTDEMLADRLRRAYPSFSRDVYNPIRGHELAPHVNIEYSLNGDMHGCDLKIDGVPICTFANTVPSKNMKGTKDNERHQFELPPKRIHLIKNIERRPGIHLFSDATILETIHMAQTNDFETNPCPTIYG